MATFKDLLRNRKGPASSEMRAIEVAAWDSDTSRVWDRKQPRQAISEDRFSQFEGAYINNPLATLLCDHLNAYLNNYRFVVGPEGTPEDVQKVKEFFNNTDIYQVLMMTSLQAIVLGTGASQMRFKGNTLDQEKPLEVIDAKTLTIQNDLQEDGTFDETVSQQGNELDLEKLLLLRLKRWPGRGHGISFMASTLYTLQGLEEVIDDVPAALKQLAYQQRVLKADLEGFETQEERTAELKAIADQHRRFNSAKSTISVMDKRHEYGLMGTVGGQGSSGQRLVPIMPIIEPLLAWTMLNFHMGLGHILQTGANKALLESQEDRIRVAMNQLRRTWSNQVEQQLVANIVGGQGKVEIVHFDGQEELTKQRELMLREVESGIVSLEHYRKFFGLPGFRDDENYLISTQINVLSGDLSPSESVTNDDTVNPDNENTDNEEEQDGSEEEDEPEQEQPEET